MCYLIYPLAPSGPPVNITIVDVSKTAINITWLPPDPIDANGIITGYVVVFKRTEIEESTEHSLSPTHLYFFENGIKLFCIFYYFLNRFACL